MNGDIRWSSTSRRFSTGEMPPVLGKNRGSGRMIGSAATKFDSTSLWVVVATCLFAFVMFVAINGFLAILWLLALGPLSLAMFGMFAKMGGVGCQRLVATLYVISLGVLIVWVASGS